MFKFKVVTTPKLENNKFKGILYLGVPKSKSTFSKDGKNSRREFTNADLLRFLEKGSPVKNVPPRPVLESVLKLHREELKRAILAGYPIVMSGNEAEIQDYFERLALRIQGWTQQFFVREGQAIWEPSQRVIRELNKGREAKTLIDTSSLRQSIVCFYSNDGSK